MGTLHLPLPEAERGKGPGAVLCCKLLYGVNQRSPGTEPPPSPPSLAGKDKARRRKTVYFSTHSGTGRFSKEQSLASL